MPTSRGWLVAATGIGLVVAGMVFGAVALQQVGVALVVLLIIATGVVRLGKHDLSIARAIVPERARSEQDVTVTLALQNKGAGAAPLLLLEDRLPSRLAGRARFTLNGIEPDGRRDVAYTVRPHRRGRYEIGPLSLKMIDPFGLARISSEAAPAETFLVHPRVERLTLPRDAGDRRSISTSALRQPTGSRGEDFYALREYVLGDDLRKVHWPSTARRGKVMIRQEETPWHTRATIVIDDRDRAHGGGGDQSSFERAVEAAASVLYLYHGAGYGFRLAGAHHPGFPSSRGTAHLHRCLDLLATMTVQGHNGDNMLLARLAELEARGAAEETLVLLTGTLDVTSAAAIGRLHRIYKQIAVVSFPAHRFSTQATKQRWEGEMVTVEVARHLARTGIRSIVLGPGEALAPAWGSIATGKARGGESTWGQKPELV
ncbi:MAG TPA: DUF58 domain-containing protein [Actinomycetota bacterium]|nr:DUF58 domain-containing protein [Actinomycetota bacterium]